MSRDSFVSECPFQVGEVIECYYPEKNKRGVDPVMVRRVLVVREIRDCLLDPLDPETIESNPNVLRGRFLIRAQDAHKHDVRSFYLESMWRPIEARETVYQVASYDPVEPVPNYDYVGPVYTSECRDSFKELLDDVNAKLNELNVVRNVAMRPLNARGVDDTTCGENSDI